MQQHPIIWTTPEPLWKEAANRNNSDRPVMAAPAILRYTTDDFMPEFLNVLATDPHRLGEYRLVKETWRGVVDKPIPLSPRKIFALPLQRLAATRKRLNGSASSTDGSKPGIGDDAQDVPLKLYQPAHQRFYLVTSCLVCQLAGLPDRKVDPGRQERAGFVMRRLLQEEATEEATEGAWVEHAWIEKDGARYWQPISDDDKEKLFSLDGQAEEVLPLFAANYTQDDQRQRRLLAGLVPAGKREAYLAASGGPEAPSGGVTAISARKALLRKEVLEPWKGLVARAEMIREKFYLNLAASENPPGDDEKLQPGPERDAALRSERAQIQIGSWFVLLDLVKFLERYASTAWNDFSSRLVQELEKIKVQPSSTTTPNLKSVLQTYYVSNPPQSMPPIKTTFASALRTIKSFESSMDKADKGFDFGAANENWPDFLFPLADPEFPKQAARLGPSLRNLTLTPLSDAEEAAQEADELKFLSDADDETVSQQERIDKLGALIVRAFDASSGKSEPAVPLAARQPANPLEGWFVIRCVYSRPACGQLHDDVVSEPTPPFQLAGYFDPDAPARPIRIGLPIDTTPAGLRKFDRNTAFVISDTLCGQIARVKGLTLGDLVRTVLPWPLHKDLDVPDGGPCKKGANASFGMICSLSIPIITICALILLMIMVNLLNIIFRWLPFFITCFPLPGLSAKAQQPVPPSS